MRMGRRGLHGSRIGGATGVEPAGSAGPCRLARGCRRPSQAGADRRRIGRSGAMQIQDSEQRGSQSTRPQGPLPVGGAMTRRAYMPKRQFR